MEPTTQAALVGGLLALLVLLLVGRSVGRRRAARASQADEAVEARHEPPAQAEPEPPVEPEAEAEPEPEPAGEVEEAGTTSAEETPAEEPPTRRRGLFGLLFGRRSRRRAAVALPESEPETETEPEPEAVPEAEAETEQEGTPDAETPVEVDAETTETPEQAELRLLREQLRALEEIVQQQVAEPPAAALARVEETAAEQSAAYLRQISLVVRGLAAHTSEDENPRRTLARVAAAVERLGVPNEMARPILPVTHELPSYAGPVGLSGPSHVAATPDDAEVEPAAPARSEDVFAGLAAAVAAPMQAPMQAPVQAPMQAPVQAPEQAPMQVPAPAPVQVPVQVPAAPLSVAPLAEVARFVDPAPTARLEEPVVAPPEVDALAAYETELEVDGGIPAYDESEVVLPVPPPAEPESSRGRRGRRSR